MRSSRKQCWSGCLVTKRKLGRRKPLAPTRPTRKNVSLVACAISPPSFRQMVEESELSDAGANGEAAAI
jgi:hypothetical protein